MTFLLCATVCLSHGLLRNSARYYRSVVATAATKLAASPSLFSNAHKLSRIHLDSPLAIGKVLPLDGEDAHYIATIMRMKKGHLFRVFNEASGEFICKIVDFTKKSKSSQAIVIEIVEQMRKPDVETKGFPFALLFAPIKKTKMKLLMEK